MPLHRRVRRPHASLPVILLVLLLTAAALSQSPVRPRVQTQTPDRPRPELTTAPDAPRQEDLSRFTKEEIEEARKRGVLESELGAYLRARREGVPESKSIEQRMTFDERIPSAVRKTAASMCTNGGFEMGTFINWTGSYGSNVNGTVNLNTLTPGFVTDFGNPLVSRHSIMPMPTWPAAWQGPFDPMVGTPAGKTPIPLPVFPNGGNHMLRLGNQSAGSQAETANMYFQVTPANADFRFRYAVVLQDPGGSHAQSQKPFFSYWIYDLGPYPGLGSGNHIIDALNITANANDPFFQSKGTGGGESLVWRRVSCHRVDLTPYIGHTVWVMFDTSDCALGAHYGYAYIDGLCETDFNRPIFTLGDSFCPGQPMIADGTKTEGETSYTWSVEETDAAGNNPVPGTLASETFQGEINAPIDLRAWYAGKGKTYQCNRYYKVTLRTNTECSTNDETSKVVLVSCAPSPTITGPPDTCDGGGTYSVNAEPGVSYTWNAINGVLSSTTGPTVNVTWNTPNPGILTVHASNACGSKDKALVVPACKDKCCQGVKLSVGGERLTPHGGGVYTFAPTLAAAPPNTMKVTATLVSTSIAYPSQMCGVSGPASSYIPSAASVPSFAPPSMYAPYSREVVWRSSSPLGTNISGGQSFPFDIALPPPPQNCTDVVTFYVKYTFTDAKCNTCELYKCYSYRRPSAPKGIEEPPTAVECPVIKNTGTSTGDVHNFDE